MLVCVPSVETAICLSPNSNSFSLPHSYRISVHWTCFSFTTGTYLSASLCFSWNAVTLTHWSSLNPKSYYECWYVRFFYGCTIPYCYFLYITLLVLFFNFSSYKSLAIRSLVTCWFEIYFKCGASWQGTTISFIPGRLCNLSFISLITISFRRYRGTVTTDAAFRFQTFSKGWRPSSLERPPFFSSFSIGSTRHCLYHNTYNGL